MPHDTTLPASAAPTTEAGRRLLDMIAAPFINESSNRGMADREWLHAIARIEAEARADALDVDVLGDVLDNLHVYATWQEEGAQIVANGRMLAPYILARLATATQSSDDAGEEE